MATPKLELSTLSKSLAYCRIPDTEQDLWDVPSRLTWGRRATMLVLTTSTATNATAAVKAVTAALALELVLPR
jgi:hypothetical protein